MSSAGILTGYDKFEIPKSQKTINGYLRQIDAGNMLIASSERELAKKYYTEFEDENSNANTLFPALYSAVIDTIVKIKLTGRINAGFISLSDTAV